MLERRTMIGGGLIGPNDTEFMGYPIVNSVEGPLEKIALSNCTEGCITRCILKYNDYSISACMIVYVLMLNDNLYLIDSHTQMVVAENSSNTYIDGFVMPRINRRDSLIEADIRSFPNQV